MFNSDRRLWEIDAEIMQYVSENTPNQNIDLGFIRFAREFGGEKRYARKEYFLRILENGEVIKRDWLIYSISIGKVFCYKCIVFHPIINQSLTENKFQSGYDDLNSKSRKIG